jgi:hypothetical protein
VERHVGAMRKAATVALFLLAVLSVVYGVLDYVRIPALKGDSQSVLASLWVAGLQFYFFWSYRKDNLKDRQLDAELEALSKSVKLSQKEDSRRAARRVDVERAGSS